MKQQSSDLAPLTGEAPAAPHIGPLELAGERVIALLNECGSLRAALQAISDEALKHHEYNPTSGKTRLPGGYTKILNLADEALSSPNTV